MLELVAGMGQGDGSVLLPTLNDNAWPRVRMRYSDDGGNSWSYERERSLGAIGQYGLAARWTQLGQARTVRTFELTSDAPVQHVWLGARVETK